MRGRDQAHYSNNPNAAPLRVFSKNSHESHSKSKSRSRSRELLNKSIQSVKFEPMFTSTKLNDSIYGPQSEIGRLENYES